MTTNVLDHTHLEISLKDLREELSDLLSRDPTVVKEVRITQFDEACEEDFEKFLFHYSYLELLVMEGRFLITDDYLKIIGAKLKKLQRLAIAMNTSITDVGLVYLSGDRESNPSEEASCPLLESLEIERACGISNKGIQTITSQLQKLQNLDLWVNEVDKNVLQCIASMKSLKNVTLKSEGKSLMTDYAMMEEAVFKMVYHDEMGLSSENGYMQRWIQRCQQPSNSE